MVLRVPDGGRPIIPSPIVNDANYIVAVSSIGKLLIFDLKELPELAKGKGNKLINIPTKKFKSGEERLMAVAVIGEGDQLNVYRDKNSSMTLKWNDLQEFISDRALRGKNYSKKFKKAIHLTVERSKKKDDNNQNE